MTRKEHELSIIAALGTDKLEEQLALAWDSGHFTKQEMDIIVRETKLYPRDEPRNTQKIEATTQMIKKLGLTKAFTLINIIQQAPYRTQKDGWIKIDKKLIQKNSKINEYQFIVIMNELANENYIKKDKGRCILNWEHIQQLYTI